MAHSKRISTTAPGLIVLVLDDSGSMSNPLPGTQDAKYAWVERLTGLMLKELLERSTDTNDGTVVLKPRYYVYLIMYGTQPQVWDVGELDIQAAVQRFAESGNSFGLGGYLGTTDTAAAFQCALHYLSDAVKRERFASSFPAMVFHLTDGASHTDASPLAEQLKQLATSDGNVLVVNAYIGTQTSLLYQGPEDFPGYVAVDEAGPDADNVRMWNMSSEVPESIRADLVERGIFPRLRPGSRLFFDVRSREQLAHCIQVVGSINGAANRRMA